VRAALNDLAIFHNQDLVCAANRRKAVGDDECRTASAERAQAFLNQRFALAIQARSRFIQDQNLRVGSNARAMATRWR